MAGVEFVCAGPKEENSGIEIKREQKIRAMGVSMVNSSYLTAFIPTENLTAKVAKFGAKDRKTSGPIFLCHLRILCVSVVKLYERLLTTESQRTQSTHRD